MYVHVQDRRLAWQAPGDSWGALAEGSAVRLWMIRAAWNIYIYIYMYIHTYMYIYIYIYNNTNNANNNAIILITIVVVVVIIIIIILITIVVVVIIIIILGFVYLFSDAYFLRSLHPDPALRKPQP